MGLWLYDLIGENGSLAGGTYSAWELHVHEMLFGFVSAAIAGFLLTALPNWTGRPSVRGLPLLFLALLWLAGRVAIVLSVGLGLGPYVVAIIDSLFPIVLSGVLVREIAGGRDRRNLPLAVIVLLFTLCNILFHLSVIGPLDALPVERIALAATLLIVILMTLIGGRITPNFTRNWMTKNGLFPLPAGFDRTDRLGLMMVVTSCLCLLVAPAFTITGILCLATALSHGYRLSRWRGLATLGEPLVFVLHVGYGWLAIGFLLAGLSILFNAALFIAALHAFTTGAVGTMVLAVMTRAARGHAGAALVADKGTVLIYALVNLSAISRVGSAAFGVTGFGYLLPALSWMAAFLLFCFLYLRFLVSDFRPTT